MTTKLTIIIAIAILGGLLMFGILHYSRVNGKQQAQMQCEQGDRKADQEAAEKQHAADMASLADLQKQLKAAQIKGNQAQAAADQATARAARLTARLDTMEKTDKTVHAWALEPIPAGLRD